MTRIDVARDLRQRATLAEQKLWTILRGRRLDGWKFRRQVPVGRYIADFACCDARLIVELDGAAHEDRALQDLERNGELEQFGWQVVRFPNDQVLDDLSGVSEAILAELRLARP
ncbi:MAG: endonuclease domain-containing protein [Pseudomonadota bacterium]